MPKRKSKAFRLFFTRPALLFAVVCLFVGGWLTYKTLSSPLGINELSSTQVSYSREAEGGFCAQVYGQCIGHDNSCVTYTDSCVQAKACAQPFKACAEPVATRIPIGSPVTKPSSTPPPNCVSWYDGCNTCQVKDGVVGICTKMACRTTTEAPRCLKYSDSTPTATPTGCRLVQVQCIQAPCEPVMVCPTPTPTAIPKPTPIGTPVSSAAPIVGGIANFHAANPCGTTGFYNYTAVCNNGNKRDLSSGSCTPVAVAIKYAEQFCRTEYK